MTDDLLKRRLRKALQDVQGTAVPWCETHRRYDLCAVFPELSAEEAHVVLWSQADSAD